ncbi:MAG: DUF2306 domain-containing protein, partial [Longimicrobiales bacterium]
MSLDPLFAAPPVVQLHAVAAMAAFLLGIVQFAAPKGTLPHRTLGYLWVGLMLMVAISSFAIYGERVPRLWGSFSAIHILSVIVLVLTPLAVLAAHRHHVNTHRWAMIALFTGALVIAGAFTLLPG